LTWLFFSFLVFSDPVFQVRPFVAWFFLTGGLGLIWVSLWINSRQRVPRRPARATLLAFPAVAVLAGTAVVAELPMQARFELSRASLDSYVDSIEPSRGVTLGGDEWVGLYRVERASRFNKCIQLTTSSSPSTGAGGFARCETEPTPTSEYLYDHLKDDWWVWSTYLSD
jgi:hypothetical protein